MSVRVVCDSTAYLPPAWAAERDIDIVPLFVHDGPDELPETEIDLDAFYRRLARTDVLPTSSQPSPERLRAAFERGLAEADAVIGIFHTGGMSGTVETARMMAEMIRAERPEAAIAVVDSESNCMQMGYAVASAADAALGGADLATCEAAAHDTMKRTRFLFSPSSLEYLRRGGRIGGASALVGGLLQITPVLTVEDCHTTVATKVRTYSRALREIAERMRGDVERHGLRRAVVHAIVDVPAAETFAREQIAPIVGAEVDVVPVGPVVGLHVGPAVGVVYETEEPLR